MLPGGQPDKIYPVPKKAEEKGESVHSDADEDGSWESDSDTEVRLAKDEGNNTGCFMAAKVLTYIKVLLRKDKQNMGPKYLRYPNHEPACPE